VSVPLFRKAFVANLTKSNTAHSCNDERVLYRIILSARGTLDPGAVKNVIREKYMMLSVAQFQRLAVALFWRHCSGISYGFALDLGD
jgi:hypothetical protein